MAERRPVPPSLCVLAEGKAGSWELNMKLAFEVDEDGVFITKM